MAKTLDNVQGIMTPVSKTNGKQWGLWQRVGIGFCYLNQICMTKKGIKASPWFLNICLNIQELIVLLVREDTSISPWIHLILDHKECDHGLNPKTDN